MFEEINFYDLQIGNEYFITGEDNIIIEESLNDMRLLVQNFILYN
jgi:hypothetical protein